jgi:hypothetical protein
MLVTKTIRHQKRWERLKRGDITNPIKPYFVKVTEETLRSSMIADKGWTLHRTHILENHKEDIYKEHGPEKTLQRIHWFYVSDLRSEILFWENALKKGTELSGWPRTFYKMCPFVLPRAFMSSSRSGLCCHERSRAAADLHCSALPVSCCDTRILSLTERQVFQQSGLACRVFTNIHDCGTNRTSHNS